MIINQIQGGRWDKFLRRLFPIKDRSIAPILASELVGQVVVQEWSTEMYKLRGDNLAVAMGAIGPIALEFSHIKIRNPQLSGNLVIVERLMITTGANLTVVAAFEGIEIAGFTPIATSFRDSRSNSATLVGNTVAVVSTNTDLAQLGGTAVARWQVLSTDSKESAFPLVLGPGSGMIIRAATVNIGLRVTLFWRERVAEPSELEGL